MLAALFPGCQMDVDQFWVVVAVIFTASVVPTAPLFMVMNLLPTVHVGCCSIVLFCLEMIVLQFVLVAVFLISAPAAISAASLSVVIKLILALVDWFLLAVAVLLQFCFYCCCVVCCHQLLFCPSLST